MGHEFQFNLMCNPKYIRKVPPEFSGDVKALTSNRFFEELATSKQRNRYLKAPWACQEIKVLKKYTTSKCSKMHQSFDMSANSKYFLFLEMFSGILEAQRMLAQFFALHSY